jgi:glycosyltransferase involved in cell wall biosynthesis
MGANLNDYFDVSIVMLTYNQETFVEKALQSIYDQDCNLNLELIIHNDCSTDQTAKLIEQFLLKNSSRITVVYVEPEANRFSTGMIFISDLLELCKGKYIAFLEGDDYWTDKNKLQKQFDLLEANPAFSISAHSFSKVYKDQPSEIVRAAPGKSGVISLQDFAKGNVIGTLTVMIRKDSIPSIPQAYNLLKIGDYPIWGLVAGLEGILYIDTDMAGYRIHDSNYFALTSSHFQASAELESRVFIASNLTDERKLIWINSLVETIEHYKSEYRNLEIHYQAQTDMRNHFELLSQTLSAGDSSLSHHYDLMKGERDHYKQLAMRGSPGIASLGIILNLSLLIKQSFVFAKACLNFPLKVVRKVWK